MLIKTAENKKADLFFLDEFTSAQDRQNQSKIIEKLFANSDITILSIVHRLETLHYYDRVHRLTDRGLIREE